MANIGINITKNGTTTLATAGKYCDRNIDVNVDVAGGGGGNLDFSNLEYVQLTSSGSSSSGNSELPDLTPFISDFNKVACIIIQGYNEAYIYLKGTDTDRSPYKDMFNFFGNRSYYSTPSTQLGSGGNCYGLDVTNLNKPEIIYLKSPSDISPQARPWRGGFIMYYEGG